jgi:hypothetical protein
LWIPCTTTIIISRKWIFSIPFNQFSKKLFSNKYAPF